MPDPPPRNALVHYVLENPWPLGVGLLLVAVVSAWVALRSGRTSTLRISAVAALAGGAVLAAGAVVTTAAEHAREVTRRFVELVAAEDVRGATGLLAPEATLHFGDPRAVGQPREVITSGLAFLADRYEIESNRITRLRGYTLDGDRGLVHLACWTDAGSGYGATPSQWVIEVARDEDEAGVWQISRMTFVSVAGREPPAGRW